MNFPFCFSNSAWYDILDCNFVFPAIRFNSGVSAIVVAFAFGICLIEDNKKSFIFSVSRKKSLLGKKI